MSDPRTLLAQYVENRSEQAFRELVGRYVDLVYSSAVRLVNGDTHLAEDVVQTVFADLARLAGTLSRDVMLGGWLHRRTCHVAATLVRGNRRRQNRERQAVEMNALQDNPGAGFATIAPVLDEAIDQLNAQDRTAILLRFFEQRDLRAIGDALGSNEDAAQKRVARALDKLRGLLLRRGVALSGAGLATLLAAEGVTAAPIGLAATASTAALAGAAAGTGLIVTFLKLMAMTKLKIAVSTVVVAGVGTTLVLEHQAQNKLHDENSALRQQADQFAAVQQENERLAGLAVAGSNRLGHDQFSELLKLRGEVGLLRRQTNDLGKLQAENDDLKSSLASLSQKARPAQPAQNSPGYYPKESWTFAGFAEPESAFQSAIWAQLKGDGQAFLASVSPEERARRLEKSGGNADAVIAEKEKTDIAKITGFQVVGKEMISEDEVHLEIYADGLDKTRKFAVKRIDNEWKVIGPVRQKSPQP